MISNRWRQASIPGKLYTVLGVLAMLIAFELFTLHFAMNTLSAIRVFASAEGYWSRAEGAAIQSLRIYAVTRNEEDYQDFSEQLRVPLGDREARRELQKPVIDRAVVVNGFLQGQIHLHDIDAMIRLVRRFRSFSPFAKAIEKWQDGDPLLSELIDVAEKLHLEVLKGAADGQRVSRLLEKISRIDRELSFVESEFSFHLGEASRWLESMLILVSLLVVVSISGAGVYITVSFAHRLTRGLNELRKAAAKVEQGDYSTTVEVQTQDELGSLTLALNKMTLSLRQQVSERETAELASETKSLFLANMSHEIRTPLNAIMGFSELLADGELSPTERANFSAIVKRTGVSLMTIINDILDIAKVEADQVEIDIESFSLKQMLSDLSTLLRMRCEEKGIQLIIEKEGEIADQLFSDPARLRQILVNIIGNSIKFTDRGSVSVHYKVLGGDLVFRVRDTGGGIPKEQVGRLFKPFSQGDSSVRKKYGGTGLGLMISRRLAQLLQGDVGLSDPQPNGGAEFYIKIRYEPDTKTRKETQEPRKLITRNVLQGKSILVVEDSKDNQLLANLYLTQAGAKVSFAPNGLVGVEIASREEFDIILMDMQMPVMDGYAATEELRRLGLRTPIIALTGYAMKGDLDRCLGAGCNAYLSKPIDREQMVACVAKYSVTNAFGSTGLRPTDQPRDLSQ